MKRRLRRAIVVLQIGLLLFAGTVRGADPAQATVVGGAATISAQGSLLTVDQATPQAIINWQSFSIPAGQTARFNLPSASAAVLNRVTGSDPSSILGSLQSNGRVFLINPHGIVIGPGAQINVGSLVASTLDVSNAEFMRGGDLRFQGDSRASIVNHGTIRAVGGDIYLIANRVENYGTLQARQGTVGLAAGQDVRLVDSDHPHLVVQPTAASVGTTGVVNGGLIEAVTAELAAHGNVYALAINNTGTIRATGSVTRNGRVYLTANRGDVSNSGDLIARSGSDGGEVTIDAGPTGTAEVTGRIDAAGERGGVVQVLGERVSLNENAVIDVSGTHGGGTALIGGDYQGGNPSLPNAARTYVGPAVQILADATDRGDGGTVVVWSDELTGYYGQISARGGATSGDGGLVEVSGKQSLAFDGVVDVAAANGASGSILLDPRDLTIQATGANDTLLTPTGILFGNPDTTTDVTISASAVEALMGNIEFQAHRDLRINESLNLTNQTAGESVIFRAGSDLEINAPIVTNGGSLSFFASDAGGANDPGATLSINANVGDFTSTPVAISFDNDGSGGIVLAADVTTSGDQDYRDPVTVANSIRLASTAGGGITFHDTLQGDTTSGVAELRVASVGTKRFLGEVGGAAKPLTSLNTNAGSAEIHANVTTSGEQHYFDFSLLIAADVTLTGQDIRFDSTVDGPHALILNASGMITLNNKVGGITPLTSLSTVAIGETRLGGRIVTTSGSQSYLGVSAGAGFLTLTDNVTLTSTSGDSIVVGTTLRDDATPGNANLSVNTAGLTSFQFLGGGLFDSLTTDAAGSTEVVFSRIVTRGDQDYGDAVEVDGPSGFTSIDGGNITFSSTLRGQPGISPIDSVDLGTRGTTTFGDEVGGAMLPLTSLSTSPSGTLVIHADVTTVGNQIYRNAVELAADVTLTSGQVIAFTGTVQDDATKGDANLMVDVSDMFQVRGEVGGAMRPLTSLTTGTAGQSEIGADVTTTGNQVYNNPVRLIGNATLSGNAVTFKKTINGNFDLGVDVKGPVIFNDVVGGSDVVRSLAVTSDTATTIDQTLTIGALRIKQDNNTDLIINADITATGLNRDGAFQENIGGQPTDHAIFFDVTGDIDIQAGHTVRSDKGNIFIRATNSLTVRSAVEAPLGGVVLAWDQGVTGVNGTGKLTMDSGAVIDASQVRLFANIRRRDEIDNAVINGRTLSLNQSARNFGDFRDHEFWGPLTETVVGRIDDKPVDGKVNPIFDATKVTDNFLFYYSSICNTREKLTLRLYGSDQKCNATQFAPTNTAPQIDYDPTYNRSNLHSFINP